MTESILFFETRADAERLRAALEASDPSTRFDVINRSGKGFYLRAEGYGKAHS